jgi:hypothetical protein
VADAAQQREIPRRVVADVAVDVVDLERDAGGAALGAAVIVGFEDLLSDLLPAPAADAIAFRAIAPRADQRPAG